MSFTISVEKRTAGAAEQLRAGGKLPAVIYGGDRTEPVVIAVSFSEFNKLYDAAGESSLIDFKIPGESAVVKVLIQDVQYDPVSGHPVHVDFRQIKMNEEMTATVEISFVGEAPAVKELSGTLIKPRTEVEVKCLPKDLVSEIEVDLGVLKSFENVIHVSDLKLPAGITVTDNPEMVIAKVNPPLSEDQLKAMEETVPANIEEIEVEKKGKKDEEAEAGDKAAAPEKK